jgi:hypothetical protein
MAIQRTAPQASVAEVLDRVLDRGIVIDAWLRVSVAGITLIDVDARVVVASFRTYVRHSEALAAVPLTARPAPAAARPAPQLSETAPRRVRLRCPDGCTFTRTVARRPASVRCPAERGRRCPVTALAA